MEGDGTIIVPPELPQNPTPTRVAFVGEGLGSEEEKQRRPFVGPSGEILWQFSQIHAGLTRDQVYIDNLLPFRPFENRDPTPDEVVSYGKMLRSRLNKFYPHLIVCLGRFSAQAILHRPVVMEAEHGKVFFSVGGKAIIPVYHPAAGIHDPEMLRKTVQGLEAVGLWLKSKTTRYEKDEPADAKDYFEYIADPSDTGPNTIPAQPVAIDTEGTPRDPWCLTFSTHAGRGVMITAKDPYTLKCFREALANDKPTVLLHNALWDLAVLRAMGIDLLEMGIQIRDTMIECRICDEPIGLKTAGPRFTGLPMLGFEEVVGPIADKKLEEYIQDVLRPSSPTKWPDPEGKEWSVPRRLENILKPSKAAEPRSVMDRWLDKKFDTVRRTVVNLCGEPPKVKMSDVPNFLEYACRDADMTLRTGKHTMARIIEEKTGAAMAVDVLALPLLDKMQTVGMLVDRAELSKLRVDLASDMRDTMAALGVLTKNSIFNPLSAEDVEMFCHEQYRKNGILKLSKPTKSKLRYSTAEEILKPLRVEHPAIEMVLDYRGMKKLDSTLEMLPEHIRRADGRLEYRFKPAHVVSGRYAMDEPNLLALDRRARGVFVAEEGWVIGSVDLNQIELRAAAGLSQDTNMLTAFCLDMDFHALTAEAAFGIKPADQDPVQHRLPSKTGNFAMLYGASAFKLEETFRAAGVKGFDLARCQKFRDAWFAMYKGMAEFFEEQTRFGKQFGFVASPLGRRRAVPGLRLQGNRWPFSYLREKAERIVMNHPIQTGASEIIKLAAPKLVALCKTKPIKPLLQIHDEYLVEVPEDKADAMGKLLVEAMTSLSPWRGVPIKASWAYAKSWGGIKK